MESRKSVRFFALVLVALSLCSLACSNDVSFDGLRVLSKSTLEKYLDTKPNVAIVFKEPADECPDCRHVEKALALACDNLKSMGHGNIDCYAMTAATGEELPESAKKYLAPKNPSVLVFRNKTLENPKFCPHPRDFAAIHKWISSVITPPAKSLDSKANKKLVETMEATRVVAFISDIESAQFKIFQEVATWFQPEIPFYYSTDEKLVKSFHLKSSPSIAVLRPGERPLSFSQKWTRDGLRSFVDQNKRASWELLHEDALHGLNFNGNFIAVLDESKASAKAFATFKTVAQDYEIYDPLSFFKVQVDSNAQSGLAKYFSDKDADPPQFTIFIGNGMKFFYDSKQGFEVKPVRKWIDAFRKGALKPDVGGENTTNLNPDSAIIELTPSTFDAKVLKSEKDVLVEFYASWCGHCKALAPIYEKLALSFKNVNSVVIAQYNGDVNPLPKYGIKGFPTLLLFKAGAKSAPIRFEGERTYEELRKFVLANAGIPIVEEKVESQEDDGDDLDPDDIL